MVRFVEIDSKDPQQMLLYNLCKCLLKKEFNVICHLYGLFGCEKASYREVAKFQKTYLAKIVKIEQSALDKLRLCKGVYGIKNEDLLGAIAGFCDCGCPYRPRADHWHMGMAFVCAKCFEKRIFNQGAKR